MHPQLALIKKELESSSDWVSRLVQWAGDEHWGERPSAESWSASECVQHLNSTSRAMLALIRPQLAGCERLAKVPRYRFSFMGWVIWRASSPPAKVKVKTKEPFVPEHSRSSKADLIAWAVYQSDLMDLLDAADGRPLNRLKIASPFDERVRYNLYSAFRIIAAHQRRHLDQAEKAIEVVRGRRT